MFVHIRCIFGHASCSLVAMLGNLSCPWTTTSDQHEAKQARTYNNITMKLTQASNAKAYTGIYTHEQVIRTTSNSNSDMTGASASALIASATTRVRHLHDMTQSGMQAIRSLFIHERLHVRASTAPCIRRPWIIQASRLYPSLSTSGRRGHALRPRNTVLLRRFLTSTSTGSTPTTSTHALDFIKLHHDSAHC